MSNTGQLTVATPTDREIVITRIFDAPRDLVFKAWTQPDLLKRWLLGPPGWSLTVCEVDLRVGGAYRYVWRAPDNSEMGMGGVHREVVVPERIVCTQLFDQDWTGGETLGTLLLTEKNGKTTVTNSILYATLEARDFAIQCNMTEGMEAGHVRLDALLATEQAK